MNGLISVCLSIISIVCTPTGKVDLTGMSPDGTWAAFSCLDETGGVISAVRSYYVVDVKKAYLFAVYDDASAPRALESLNIGLNHIDKLDLQEDSTLFKQRRGDGTWYLRLKTTTDGYDLEFTPTLETSAIVIYRQATSGVLGGGTPKYRFSGALATKLGSTIFVVRTLIPNSSSKVPDIVYILDPDARTCYPVQH
jgi:hypothetical protein